MTIKCHQGLTVIPHQKELIKNLVGAFLILIISILMIATILIPELARLFDQAKSPNDFLDWVAMLGSYLIVGCLIVFFDPADCSRIYLLSGCEYA